MGRAEKFKQQRKVDAYRKEEDKVKKKLISFASLGVILVLAGLTFGGIKLYLYLNNKNKEPEKERKVYTEAPQMQIDAAKKYEANIETSKGTIKVNLFSGEAPKTVNNFVFLAREGFYDGLKFHRMVKDFMIQGGDPSGDGTGGPGYRFDDEPIVRDYTKGILAMANSGPNTNGSQFFIMQGDYSGGKLPKNYTIFAEVIEGMDVVDAIAATPTEDNGQGEQSKPLEEVKINKITITEAE